MAQSSHHGLLQLSVFIIIVTKVFKVSGDDDCRLVTYRGLLTAECINGLKKIPNSLNPKIQVLDLSESELTEISSKNLKQYSKIRNLTLTGSPDYTTSCKAESKVFLSIPKLELLYLADYDFEKVTFEFPSSLRMLQFNRSPYTNENLNVSRLNKLVHFSAFTTRLRKFPDFHKLAPLKILDFRYNAIQELPLEVIARYCKLKIFRLDVDSTDIPKNLCLCSQLYSWFKEHNITGLNPNQHDCINKGSNCTDNVINQMRNNYAECLHRSTRLLPDTYSLYYEIFFLILAILIFLIVVLYFVFSKRASENTQPNQNFIPNKEPNEDEEDELYEDDELTYN